MSNVRLTGTFTLRSPLSHIGESISTTTYLSEEPICQPDGTVESVFAYSGNAWRGQLRDLAATYLLEHLGSPRLPLDSFHLLFSGGMIGGDQVIDLERARRFRRTVPLIAVWGGGIGNQILPGKLRVANSYPICVEALPALPSAYQAEAVGVSYRSLTFEKSFSRHDDSRDDRLDGFRVAVPDAPLPALAEAPPASDPNQLGFSGLVDEVAPEAAPDETPAVEQPTRPRARRRADGPATQMRMTSELLVTGTRLYTEIELLSASEIELGCLVSALHAFSRSPHIGGQANRGHGKVTLYYQLLDLDSGETQEFLAVTDGPSRLASPAKQAKAAYDTFLRQLYDELLAAQQGEIRQLLGVQS